MIPATVNFTSWVGDTVRLRVQLTTPNPEDPTGPEIPLLLDGAVPAAQARITKKSPDVMQEFRANVIDATNGIIELYAPASEVNLLNEGKFPWDMQITWPAVGDDLEGDVGTYLAGTWTLTQDVTKAVTG